MGVLQFLGSRCCSWCCSWSGRWWRTSGWRRSERGPRTSRWFASRCSAPHRSCLWCPETFKNEFLWALVLLISTDLSCKGCTLLFQAMQCCRAALPHNQHSSHLHRASAIFEPSLVAPLIAKDSLIPEWSVNKLNMLRHHSNLWLERDQ